MPAFARRTSGRSGSFSIASRSSRADVVSLARWTAEYYAAGAGETITAVLPPKTRGERADAHKTRRVATLTAAGLGALESPALTSKQREALEILSGVPDGLPTPALAARGIGADTVSRLARQGLIGLRQERVDRDPFESAARSVVAAEANRRLTGEQSLALGRLARARRGPRVSRGAAARGDGQRQDRNLPAAVGLGARARAVVC